jgi:cyclohexanone monooxygenase
MTKLSQDIDIQALKQKYDAERRKRLRSDGNGQYVHPEGQLAHYLDDPYAERRPRGPIAKDVEVAILGGGFGGLLAAARLREAGIDDICIIEKGGDFGGTWYWNRYPGAACDVESYIYLPLLEEVGYVPIEKYSRAPEILKYAMKMGEKYDLYRQALFHTEIKELRWDEAFSRWIVSTDRGDRIRARFFVMASGPLQEPKLPGIPGIERFRGHSFHTSRWDYKYTGGDSYGGLTRLQDKTVGIIGTGATALQCVSHLGQWSRQLYVFQRTPSTVDIRGNRPTDPEWVKTLTPGWQKRRMDNYTAVVTGRPMAEDLVDDYWTKDMFATVRRITPDMTPQQLGELFELTDFAIMERIRARVDSIVKDKTTAEALRPWYKRMCKRPGFHDDYLQTFNRPNVALIDTDGKGVERITEDSAVVAGKPYKVDCLIYATGFELAAYTSRAVMPVLGRGGLPLTEKWKEGATTLHGFFVHGFPNFLILSTTQTAWGPNFPHMMEEQSRHIAYVLKQLRVRGAKTAEVTAEAEREWVTFHEQCAGPVLKVWADCTPSYFNNEGNQNAAVVRGGGFGGGVFKFVEILEKWRGEGNLRGLNVN